MGHQRPRLGVTNALGRSLVGAPVEKEIRPATLPVLHDRSSQPLIALQTIERETLHATMVTMRIVIEGFDLPGRTFCAPDGSPLMNVHVGVQIKSNPSELVRGDATEARWEVDVRVSEQPDGSFDFRGPAVHGRRGERFMYLTWGSVDDDGAFHMFRRAKLMLDRIEPKLVAAAERQALPLIARVRLTDDRGGPRCARVDPPDLTWAIGPASPPG